MDLSQGYNQDVSWDCCHLMGKWEKEPLPSKLTDLARCSSSWAVGLRSCFSVRWSSVLCHVGLLVESSEQTWQLAPSEGENERATGSTGMRESASEKEITIFVNPILDMIAFHGCHILRPRTKSLGPVYTQAK